MSNPAKTFVQQCLDGEALLEDLDDAVERWHTGDATCSLAESLGLTDDEYAILVTNPDAIRAIVHARRSDTPLIDALESTECTTLAARAKSRSEAEEILKWLRSANKIS